MYLNFSKIDSAKREPPMLRLQTLTGKELGPVPFASGVHFELNYADLSTIEFEVPYMANGLINPLYSSLTGYKVIYTDELGIYLITSPEKSGDGVSEVKQVKGYSLEYMFQRKDLYLQEGTYNFWNPMFPDETILGRIVELDPNWSVGYVAPRLIGCYRTFDEYDDNALGFLYGDAMESYRCAVVFDVYNKTINAYDAGDDAVAMPIYLDYQNLVKEIQVEEITDDMATKLYVYGADSLSIRNVNPMGTDYMVDLSYFLSNGDLDVTASDNPGVLLSDKVRTWRADILEQQSYYTGLASLRSSATARKLKAGAELTELQGELQALTATQSTYIQQYALETTTSGKKKVQAKLNTVYTQIEDKNDEISDKESEIASTQAEIDNYVSKMAELTAKYSITGYFTEGEQLLLAPFLIEGTLEEDTFVVSDVADTDSAVLSTVSGAVTVADSSVARVTLSDFGRTMYTLSGGTLTISGANLSAEVVRGTLDVKTGNSYTLSVYLGKLTYNSHEFDSGMITLTGTLTSLSTDVTAVTENEITQYLGTKLSFRTTSAAAYFTVAASDYQQYAVEMELYDFASDALSDYAWPTYEFSIDSANFLYHELFEPFKKELELGKAVYLRLGSEGVLQPKVIGVELDFDDIDDFKLVFSNRYQRKNQLEYLQDELRNASSASKRFDATKYLYDRTADKMTGVQSYMNDMLDAAVQTIKAASNQSVIIDGAGIHVSTTDTTNGNDKIELRIVNGMIAMSNDNWKTAKLAIGRFYSDSLRSEVWGVNAELIAGSLIIGNNLYIETDDGYFTVDNSGVYIKSKVFYINNGEETQTLDTTLTDIDNDITAVDKKADAVTTTVNKVTTTTDAGVVYLDADDLKGLISATQAQMQGAGGNVLFDGDGIWLLNNKTKATSTKAVWMNDEGIVFGSGPRSTDPAADTSGWTWTTAISHSGVVADSVIAGGTLSGLHISGGDITIGKSSTSDTAYLYVDSDGNLGTGSPSIVNSKLQSANFFVSSSGNLGIGYKSSATKKYNFYVDNQGNLYSGYSSSNGGYNFTVDTSGNIIANSITVTKGTFSGTLSAATGSISNIESEGGTFKDITAVSGTFSGTLSAANISGNLTSNSEEDGWVVGCGLAIGGVTYNSKKVPTSANFFVDSSGNVTIKSGSIKFSDVKDTDDADKTIGGAIDAANTAASDAKSVAEAIASGTYTAESGTFINGTTIYGPTIVADEFVVQPKSQLSNNWTGGYSMYGYYGKTLYEMLNINYGIDMVTPVVNFKSEAGAYAYWYFSMTKIFGNISFMNTYRTPEVDFTNATVKGLDLTAKFG